jgi:hypothetical protein
MWATEGKKVKVEYGQRNGRKSVCEKGGKDVKT